MAKEEPIQYEGIVVEVLGSAKFRVKLDNGHLITAYASGNMHRNRIKILMSDSVTVEMTPYDLTQGRIVHRKK